jgi:hypothetical protein
MKLKLDNLVAVGKTIVFQFCFSIISVSFHMCGRLKLHALTLRNEEMASDWKTNARHIICTPTEVC